MTVPRSRAGRALAGVAAMVLALAAGPALEAAGTEARVVETPQRIVAIGDVHGAADALREVLRETKLIDESDRWIGGASVLVQTGDVFDRGAGVRDAVELLRSLEKQAPKSGGEVHVLLGNHEVMNLTLQLRDVDAEIVAPWAGRRSEKRRDQHCEEAWRREVRLAARVGAEEPAREGVVARCLEATPPGWLEYIEDLGPRGDLGRWLRERRAVLRLGDWVFLHGGLTRATAARGVDEVDEQVHDEIATFDRLRRWLIEHGLALETASIQEIRQIALAVDDAVRTGQLTAGPRLPDLAAIRDLRTWYLFADDGPLWFRGYARWSDEEGRPEIDAIVDLLGARALVVGHTPRPRKGIGRRFGDRVFLIDTGMLREVYGGRPGALVIENGEVEVVYGGD